MTRVLSGIVLPLRKLRFCLVGRRLHVYKDHGSLTYILEQVKLSDLSERWLGGIVEFDFTIYRVPDIRNVLPDCVSRM
jgi:hypothetical protein